MFIRPGCFYCFNQIRICRFQMTVSERIEVILVYDKDWFSNPADQIKKMLGQGTQC